MALVIDNAHKTQPDTRMPRLPNEAGRGDVRLALLPPGRCDMRLVLSCNIFDVNLAAITHQLALNSDRLCAGNIAANSIAFLPSRTDFHLRVDNPLPGLVLEVSDAALSSWMAAGEMERGNLQATGDYLPDPVAADLGRAGIRHLMRAARSDQPADHLTVEALALGIAARGMAQLAVPDGDIDAEITRWNREARRREIDRAIDLIEARLCDSDLSIRDLAEAACLSSSRFASVFRSMVGETPYAFILRRRAEYAHDLIVGTREPLSQIAYAAGFCSQAHMTVVVKRVFGTTPAAMRG